MGDVEDQQTTALSLLTTSSDNFSLFLHLIHLHPFCLLFFALVTLLPAILYHFCLIIKFLHSKYPPCTGCTYRMMKFGLSNSFI